MADTFYFLHPDDDAADSPFSFAVRASSLTVDPFIIANGGNAQENSGAAKAAFSAGGAAQEEESVQEMETAAGQYFSDNDTRNGSAPAAKPAASGRSLAFTANNAAGLLFTAGSPLPGNLSGTDKKLTWSSVSGATAYRVEYILGAENIVIQTESTGIEHFGLPKGDWNWNVRVAEEENGTDGNEIRITALPTTPQLWQGQADGLDEVFFSRKYNIWTADYQARHVGVMGGWKGTDETAALEGKNQIADIFSGAETDFSILLLTDDANGDALFVDDIYTELPGELKDQQARIAGINEIRAGAGDDVVDLTSQQFAYVGSGVTVRGGSGNDVIWANIGNNRLFGDAGNDRLVGAGGNDILAGGSGDDSLHGGGGDDIFCFCANWGRDTVQQLSGGAVTLWFTEGDQTHWHAETMTYTDGDNSVTVSGVTAVTLKFGSGEDEADARKYKEMQACGAFVAASSEKIFGIITNNPGGMEFPTEEEGRNPDPLA